MRVKKVTRTDRDEWRERRLRKLADAVEKRAETLADLVLAQSYREYADVLAGAAEVPEADALAAA